MGGGSLQPRLFGVRTRDACASTSSDQLHTRPAPHPAVCPCVPVRLQILLPPSTSRTLSILHPSGHSGRGKTPVELTRLSTPAYLSRHSVSDSDTARPPRRETGGSGVLAVYVFHIIISIGIARRCV